GGFMRHALAVLLIAVAGAALAQPAGVERGKLKKIDADNLTVTITQGDKDRTFSVDDETVVFGAKSKDVKERLATLKEGAEVEFKPARRGGKDVLAGIKAAEPKADTSKFKALNELGKDEYKGYKGGLYPDGKNERPEWHEKAGLALAKKVQPLGADGKPS